jgi:hypothetical protein
MEYKGVDYSVVQLLEGIGWRWEVRFGDGKKKTGVTPISRASAIKLAKYQIDRAVKERK